MQLEKQQQQQNIENPYAKAAAKTKKNNFQFVVDNAVADNFLHQQQSIDPNDIGLQQQQQHQQQPTSSSLLVENEAAAVVMVGTPLAPTLVGSTLVESSSSSLPNFTSTFACAATQTMPIEQMMMLHTPNTTTTKSNEMLSQPSPPAPQQQQQEDFELLIEKNVAAAATTAYENTLDEESSNQMVNQTPQFIDAKPQPQPPPPSPVSSNASATANISSGQDSNLEKTTPGGKRRAFFYEKDYAAKRLSYDEGDDDVDAGGVGSGISRLRKRPPKPISTVHFKDTATTSAAVAAAKKLDDEKKESALLQLQPVKVEKNALRDLMIPQLACSTTYRFAANKEFQFGYCSYTLEPNFIFVGEKKLWLALNSDEFLEFLSSPILNKMLNIKNQDDDDDDDCNEETAVAATKRSGVNRNNATSVAFHSNENLSMKIFTRKERKVVYLEFMRQNRIILEVDDVKFFHHFRTLLIERIRVLDVNQWAVEDYFKRYVECAVANECLVLDPSAFTCPITNADTAKIDFLQLFHDIGFYMVAKIEELILVKKSFSNTQHQQAQLAPTTSSRATSTTTGFNQQIELVLPQQLQQQYQQQFI